MTKNQFKDSSSLHSYRTELPNIIYYLGLDCYELAYYSYIKKIAGDSGSCTRTQSSIAKILGCSQEKIRRMNLKLSKFDRRIGTSLISVKKRMKSKKEKDSNRITINDIWNINMEVMIQVKKRDPKESFDDAMFKIINVPSQVGEGTLSGWDKEDPLKKDNSMTLSKKESKNIAIEEGCSPQQFDAIWSRIENRGVKINRNYLMACIASELENPSVKKSPAVVRSESRKFARHHFKHTRRVGDTDYVAMFFPAGVMFVNGASDTVEFDFKDISFENKVRKFLESLGHTLN